MPQWLTTNPAGLNRAELEHALKSAIAATVSILVSRLCHLPEAYWAAVASMVVMQSTLGASLSISVSRLIGDALGALAGALLAVCFGANVYVFGAGVLLLGVLTAALHLDRAAYRFTGIAMVVVMLIPRPASPWIVALHRFSEISIGIVVGLFVVLIWSEHAAAKTGSPA